MYYLSSVQVELINIYPSETFPLSFFFSFCFFVVVILFVSLKLLFVGIAVLLKRYHLTIWNIARLTIFDRFVKDSQWLYPGFQWGSCYSIFSFMCMFCRSLFVLFSFGHSNVCSSSIYRFWLPLWYLQTLLTFRQESLSISW
jgi:hypothetical protein